jgi:hypothetical protein
MNRPATRLVAVAAFFMILVSIGIFALPRVVRALPGSYVMRLQNHPLTSGVVELVTTPMPDALPASAAGRAGESSPVLDIPGIAEQGRSFGNPDILAAVDQAPPTPQPSPTRETIVITIGESATPEPGEAEPVEAGPTATPEPLPTATRPPLPGRVMLENLPVEIQTFNNCGPANMTIVLNYWGVETTQTEAASYLKPNREDRNVSPWQINDYVNEFTSLKSTAHASGTPDIVKQFVAAGFPVVIEKGYEPEQDSEGWYGHYLTVYGYDDTRQEFYSRDTYLGPTDGSPRIDSYDEFMKWWQQFYYTFYVIYPEHRAAEVFSIIPEVLQDDETMWQHTVEIARRELQADPDNVFTWFNLGVALTRLGEVSLSGNEQFYREATQAFDRAREIGLPPRTLYYEHRPLMAYYKTGRINDVLDLTGSLISDTAGGKWVEEIHWYRGHALASNGELRAAQESYLAALDVNPNFYYAQWSLDYVNSLLGE